MKQCKCGGLIKQQELTMERISLRCEDCGIYEIVKPDVVEHYARLSLMPGWIDYVRHQVKQMEKHPSGLWIGLGQAVADKIKELKNES